MTYKNSRNRIRLNKTETVLLLDALRHALDCRTPRCSMCADGRKLMKQIEAYIAERKT